MLAPGAPAPQFALPDQTGTVQNAKSLKGKRYLVYFYPKDSTPGCTVQACGIQSDLSRFNKLGIPVFGVSMDSVASHRKFADKFKLTFPLLADTERSLIEAFGVWVEKSMYGKQYMGISRSSFLVGANGKIEQVWEKVNTKTHAADVLAYIQGGTPTAVAAQKPATAKAPAKKAPARKAPVKKTAAKKAPAKKTVKKK
ncbi:MAG: thioredoxin-dependent thiol peroxidase [Arenimonas sp.]|uniref:thioredoxin-dependent thiol peroxidase n=1 Tax=Arenimonas sp. TaxID=1872635 RepID=UPI003C07AD4C